MFKTLISIALLSTGTPALAKQPNDATSVRIVQTADLNLARAAGVAQLDRRLRRAVESVCVRDNTQELGRMRVSRACRAAATRDAARQRDALLASIGSTPAVRIASAP